MKMAQYHEMMTSWIQGINFYTKTTPEKVTFISVKEKDINTDTDTDQEKLHFSFFVIWSDMKIVPKGIDIRNNKNLIF